MIVGAGLGGVTLTLLLERADVNYVVFEKATLVKPLGKRRLPLSNSKLVGEVGVSSQDTPLRPNFIGRVSFRPTLQSSIKLFTTI